MGDVPDVAKDQGIAVNKSNKDKVKRTPAGDKTVKRPNSEKAVKKSPSDKNNKNSTRVWFSPAEYKLRQSLPPQLPRRPTDIYLTSGEGREVLDQQGRAIKLLQEGETVWLHSIGLNIPKCITFVNKLKKDLDKLEVDSFTHTWELSDNWASLEEEVGQRYNSGLHVRCKVVQ